MSDMESPEVKQWRDKLQYDAAAGRACRALGLTREQIDEGALGEVVEALREVRGGHLHWKTAQEFGGYTLDDETLAEIDAALAPFPTTTPTEDTK